MLFVCLLTYQYINAQRDHRVWREDVRALLGEDEADDYIPRVYEGLPPGADGTVNLHIDPFLEYVLDNGETRIWAPEIKGRMVCGNGGNWTFTHEAQHTYREDFSFVGLILVLVGTVLITAAVTGIWPIIMSIQDSINMLIALLEEMPDIHNAIVDNEVYDKFRKGTWKDKIKYIWIMVSMVCNVLLAAVLTHCISATLGLPVISKTVQDSKCYFINGASPDMYRPSHKESGEVDANLTRRHRAMMLEEIGEDADTRPRAEVKMVDDDTVDFFLNCEASLYEASSGAIWSLEPSNVIVCTPVYAWQIVTAKGVSRQKCTAGSWSGSRDPNAVAKENGMDRAIDFSEHGNGMKCGLWNLGRRTVKGFGVYSYDEFRNWSFCNCVPSGKSGLVRIDPVTQEKITIEAVGQLTVDSNAIGRQYGWYTSGDEEVVITATFDKGRGSALVFDDSMNDTAKDKYVRDYVFTEDAHGVHARTASVLTQPNGLQCTTYIRLTGANRFVEFQRSCSDVVATRADNEVAGVKFTTTSTDLCSITVGFQDDNRSSVVSINALRPATIHGADRWRCITQENHGVSCSSNQSFEMFSPQVVSESRNTVVLESDKVVNGRGGIDVSVPGIKAPGFSWLNDVFEVLKLVATLVTVISIIITLIQVGLYLLRRYKKKKALEEGVDLEDVDANDRKKPLDKAPKKDSSKGSSKEGKPSKA
jgi:hypothetical protein